MIPQVFIQLENIPLTPNGKVDRRALPELSAEDFQSDVELVEPRNESEEKLLAMWKELLAVEEIGVH